MKVGFSFRSGEINYVFSHDELKQGPGGTVDIKGKETGRKRMDFGGISKKKTFKRREIIQTHRQRVYLFVFVSE